jgi:hypothetical protein
MFQHKKPEEIIAISLSQMMTRNKAWVHLTLSKEITNKQPNLVI